ncbi:MAG: YhdH/YhfP family quinone oxidoreductase [Pseudomonadota bacterium]
MVFKAYRVFETDGEITSHLSMLELNDLSPGDVVIRVEYSSINYKDALAATGRGKIMRQLPLNAGIDCAGVVESSSSDLFKKGDRVLVNGAGMGEVFDGGLAQLVRVNADLVVPLPPEMSSFDAMAIGTAGFTAALCIHRMRANGQERDMGPIAVTGASGGVGSVAICLLAKMGFEVVAISGREEHHAYLKDLGAATVTKVEDLNLGTKPLEKTRFGGVIDNTGGEVLSQLFAHTELWGNIACVGMAASPKLQASVFPLILRGVSLLGISSANCPMPLRKQIWQSLGKEYPAGLAEKIVEKTVPLTQIGPCFTEILDRQHRGRLVVDCQQ